MGQIVIALETSCQFSSVAVACDKTVIAKEQVRGARQMENILSLLEKVLAGQSLKEIRAVVVSLGPGTFSGTRIALTVGKALCMVTKATLVGMSAFEALAYRWRGLYQGKPITFLLPMGPVKVARQSFDGQALCNEVVFETLEEALSSSLTCAGHVWKKTQDFPLSSLEGYKSKMIRKTFFPRAQDLLMAFFDQKASVLYTHLKPLYGTKGVGDD